MIRLFNCFWQAGQQGLITWRDGLKVALRGTIYMPCSASHMTIRFFLANYTQYGTRVRDQAAWSSWWVRPISCCVSSVCSEPVNYATLSLKLKKKKHTSFPWDTLRAHDFGWTLFTKCGSVHDCVTHNVRVLSRAVWIRKLFFVDVIFIAFELKSEDGSVSNQSVSIWLFQTTLTT